MFRGTVGKLPGWLAALVVVGGLLSPGNARAQNASFGGAGCASCTTGGCATCASCATQPSVSFGTACCQHTHCPHYTHCSEGPICIHFRCGCPKPVCNPCDLQNYGYTETCWSRGPWQSNWSHCPNPPAAALVGSAVLPQRTTIPTTPRSLPEGELLPPPVGDGIRPGL